MLLIIAMKMEVIEVSTNIELEGPLRAMKINKKSYS